MSVGQAPQFVSGDPLFVLDERLQIVAWNAAVEELTGVAAEEAIGKPRWSVLAGRRGRRGRYRADPYW